MKTDKTCDTIKSYQEFKDTWTLENALYVLEHKTVESEIWAEAVEWLLLYGPPHIKEILLSASGSATSSCFPSITNDAYFKDGEPCYSIEEIAKVLNIDLDEAKRIMEEKGKAHGVRFTLDKDEVMKKH